jgi:3-(3-hydroxy-phenyl)propionate hydroxylase
VYERTYQPPTPGTLPHSTNLAQVETERYLLEACKQAGVEFAWDAEVAHVRSGPDELVVTTAALGNDWRAQYVVAADGVRSAVREAVGITLVGSIWSHQWTRPLRSARPPLTT